MQLLSICGQASLLLTLTQAVASGSVDNDQTVLKASRYSKVHGDHIVPAAVLAALEAHEDPVDAMVAIDPDLKNELSEPRLLHVSGRDGPEWMTEGDKMRLKRKGQRFIDITEHRDIYNVSAVAGKPNLPPLRHGSIVRSLLPKVSTKFMNQTLTHLTSFYNRLYTSPTGEQSSQWLHEQVAKIIAEAPFHTHISLEYFTHKFGQTSTIARFEPRVRDFDKPLTILGAHQDSANYMFPLLPAPGADDDGSGSVSILEAFRVLAMSGFIPKDGPVEFHWYAAEEAGTLGSRDIAAYKKKSNATIGAMMEFDMTAFVSRNATESITFITTGSDKELTEWAAKLSKEYISIPTEIHELFPGAGSDYMSFTRLGYPATFASEGDPVAGDFDPYVHSMKDTMDVDDEHGYFSIDHMARFSEVAIAFAVEQAGWDNAWR